MKHISIEYSASGLNSQRLILNAIIDLVEGNEERGIVEVSPEVHLEDVQMWMEDSLTYKVNAGIMTRKNLKTGKSVNFLQAMIG